MSAVIQEVMDLYRAGNHVMVMQKLGPIMREKKKVEPALALMLAQSCMKLDQTAQAAQWYDRACVPGLPNLRQVQILAANVYVLAGNWQRAYEITRDMLKSAPRDYEAMAIYRNAMRMLQKYDEAAASDAKVAAAMQADEPGIFDMENPLDHIFWSDNDAFAARLTRKDPGTAFDPTNRKARHTAPHVFGDRIKIGYLSNDFSDRHATMLLAQSVLTGHDKASFDVYHICYTNSALVAADRMSRYRMPKRYDVHNLNDQDVVDLIRKLQIDILVDLKGHTRDARPGILNEGAAPIQVAWLGFPGLNTGIDCDYMIGDSIVTPPEKQGFWDANFCRLPESYQPNDNLYRPLPPATPRSTLGLPEDKVVFASFNNQRKISQKTFRIWSAVLKAVPDSILWISIEGDAAQANLVSAMQRAGIKRSRIHFTTVLTYPDHIARLQSADIALDTFPCNGHTTTSDMLWAGLPVVTLKGQNFASRVSESLLSAFHMPDLVTESEEACVALYVRLGTDKAFRQEIRDRIAANRFRAPLFDTERFIQHLEDAYRTMVERARNGLPPAPIDIAARAPRTTPFRP